MIKRIKQRAKEVRMKGKTPHPNTIAARKAAGVSAVHREKLRIANTGKRYSKATKEKHRNNMLGNKHATGSNGYKRRARCQ